MLAGRRLFDEPSVSDTAAAVLKGELTFDALPRDTPSAVRRVISRCLTRDSRRRLRDVGEARIAIDALADPTEGVASASVSTDTARAPRWRRILPWAITGVAAVGAVLSTWAPWRATYAPRPVTRLTSDFGADITL